MKYITEHWLGIICSFLIFCFLVMFILVLLSPRQDTQKRGFIPCTEKMVEQMSNCQEESKFSCMLTSILKNSWCDMSVIAKGINNWIHGKQTFPWSNYIFIPTRPQDEDFDAEARKEYLQKNPDFQTEMQQLKEKHMELKHEQKNIIFNPKQ